MKNRLTTRSAVRWTYRLGVSSREGTTLGIFFKDRKLEFYVTAEGKIII